MIQLCIRSVTEPMLFRRFHTAACLGVTAALLVLAGCSQQRDSGAGTLVIDPAQMQLLESDSLLYDIRHVLAAGDGDVWVLSGSEPYVYRYDASGKLLERFGRQGKGPGELLNPWSLVTGTGGRAGIGVWDVSARQVVRYDREGRFQEAVAVPIRGGTVRGDIRDVSFGEPFRMRAAGPGFVVQAPIGSITHTRDLYGTMLVRVGQDGAVRDTLLRFDALLPKDGRSLARSLTPIPLWASCSDGAVAVFEPHAGIVRWYGTPGDTAEWEVPFTPRALTDDDIRVYLRHVLELEARSAQVAPANPEQIVEMMLERTRDQFGTAAPDAVEMLCDGRKRLWLNLFSTADHPLGYGREWRVFDAGRPAHTIRFPAGFRPAQVGEDRVLGVFTDDDDVQHPAFVRLPAPRPM